MTGKLAAGLISTLLILGLSKEVSAQQNNGNALSQANITEETTFIDHNLVYTTSFPGMHGLTLGLNTRATNNANILNTDFASKWQFDKEKSLYLYISNSDQETHAEIKAHVKPIENSIIGMGLGTGGLMQIMGQYGFGGKSEKFKVRQNNGIALAFVGTDSGNDLKTLLWRYWKNLDMFTGVSNDADNVTVVYSLQKPFYSRLTNVIQKEGKSVSTELIISPSSRQGNSMYTLWPSDSFFRLEDDALFGPAPHFGKNTLGYIPAPFAMRSDDIIAKATLTFGDVPSSSLEIADYITENKYVGVFVRTTDGDNVTGVLGGLANNYPGNNLVGIEIGWNFQTKSPEAYAWVRAVF